MEIGKGSLTALISAFGRAYHSLNAEPKIFVDFLAKSMMTDETYDFIGHSMANSLGFFAPEFAATNPSEADALSYAMRVQSTPVTLGRARFAEECLESAMGHGLSQYVILGAGLDTFAFRRPELVKKLQVYELDQPVTQDYKRNRLKELGWDIPEELHMLPVDFSKDNLAEALTNAGFDSDKKSFFSWLGVTYYLEQSDVFSALERMAGIAAAGSLILFDYLDAEAFDDQKASNRVKKMMEMVKNAGEPMKTAFEPSELQEQLLCIGLSIVEDLGPEEIQKAYYDGRNDGYLAFEHFHYAKVKVL